MLKIQLQINHTRGKHDVWKPIFTCEVCEEEITDAHNALYHFLMSSDEQADQQIYITHKGQCDRIFEAAMKERAASPDYHTTDEHEMWGQMPLEYLIGYIINNLGMDWVKLVDGFAPTKAINALKKNRPKTEFYPEIGKRI